MIEIAQTYDNNTSELIINKYYSTTERLLNITQNVIYKYHVNQ